ncbi:prolipoprotein diacylglyceryl transferase [Candidatus Uhrbacteria bacterium]|nr:prolipoprotein diacylglyceryl transferase [Candidatus Uhrbacteria bacterium]
MLPYFNTSTFSLGPLTIHTWGFVVSLGFLVAILVAYRRAKHTGLNANRVLDLAFWIIALAFIGARIFHVFFYEWGYFQDHLFEIVRIDQGGLSSFGGFIGATVAFIIFTRKYHLDRWRYADLLMFAWPLGHALGRIGCFLTHMHPGRLSSVWWAVQYPGGARLDMGMAESVVLLSYWVIMLLVSRKHKRFDGFYLISGMIFYGATRFILDFFRATDLPMSDARYLGLTPAQYGSIALVIIALTIWKKRAQWVKSA